MITLPVKKSIVIMKITIANKRLADKPLTKKDKGLYFGNLSFSTKEFDIDEFKDLVSNGFTVTYVYKDNEFRREDNYMKNNYVGTQFIIVDIDECEINPKEFVDDIKHKPTFFHTTFGNLTERKGLKYCFHLIYVLDQFIYGEKRYKEVFDYLVSDYGGFVDKAATDPHRCFFTSNCDLPYFQYGYTGIVYNVSEIPEEEQEEPETAESEEETVNGSPDCPECSDIFLNDIKHMRRSDFLDKYGEMYPLVTSTPVEFNDNGYADLDGIEYYELQSLFRYDKESGKMTHRRVQIGKRTVTLYKRACVILKILPGMTFEWFVTAVTRDVYDNFDNSDKEMSTVKILGICKGLWSARDNVKVKQSGKKIRVDTGFWAKNGLTVQQAVGTCRKMNNEERVLSLYDVSDSLENNLENIAKSGVKTTKRYVKELLKKNGIEILTEKDLVRKKAIELRQQGLTVREIAEKTGISFATVSRILK